MNPSDYLNLSFDLDLSLSPELSRFGSHLSLEVSLRVEGTL